MNYYRRYCGDYARDTAHLCLAEHGAYTLLLDAYYSAERPLPASIDLLYRICRAMTAEERRAVDRVAEVYFPIDGEFRHNARADRELGIAQKVIETAKENGKAGGRPRNETRTETKKVTKKKPANNPAGFETQTQTEPGNNHPPTTNHQPPAPTPNTNPQPPTEAAATRARPQPNPDDTAVPVGTAAAAALEKLKPEPLSLQEASIDSEAQTPAGILASVCVANGIRAAAFNQPVVEWSLRGVSVNRLKEAIVTARQRKPAPQNIPLQYLDTILRDEGAPKGDSRWAIDEDACMAKAKELGLWPMRGPDNSWEGLRQKIREALRNQAREQVH